MQPAVTIGKRAFLVSFFALLAIIVFVGILSASLPAGEYSMHQVEGRQVLDPDSYVRLDSSDFPWWKVALAPVLVLFSADMPILLVITLFIVFVSGSITVLQNEGIIPELIRRTASRFEKRKTLLLALLVLIFMAFGALMGIFEEVILLVPIAISISRSLGWDRFAGLGFSILAAGFGFSAAISNPFSIGVAQQIAGLPLFSGAGYRLIIFAVTYALLLVFLLRYVRRLESGLPGLDGEVASAGAMAAADDVPDAPSAGNIQLGMKVFLSGMAAIALYLLLGAVVPGLSDYSMPVIALLFVLSACATAKAAGARWSSIGVNFRVGSLAVLPGVVLILMAASVKYIAVESKILHTILHAASLFIQDQSEGVGIIVVYLLVFVLNLFVGSASAKALLVMPIITPLADILGFTRQTAVLAYSFGDGFSNLLFPTNAVLLIALGISGVSYGKWFRFVIPIQALMFMLSILWLLGAQGFGYGPY